MNHAYACIAISPLLFKYRLLRSVLVGGMSCLETSTPATICEFVIISHLFSLLFNQRFFMGIGYWSAGSRICSALLSVRHLYLLTHMHFDFPQPKPRYQYIYAETYTPTIHNEVLLATSSISSSFLIL